VTETKSFLDGRAVLHCGDCVDVIKTLPDNSIDAVVTDPPYALTQNSRGGSPRKNDPKTPFGRTRIGDKGFMGMSWDNGDVAHNHEFWVEVLRVLKPGGHVVAFAGTRTYHRLAISIEDAGFEIRDMVSWVYAQGMPKSLDVSKAIDKKFGAEREVVGVKPGHEEFVGRKTQGHMGFKNGSMFGFDRPWMYDEKKREASHYKTVPATEEAKRWDGFGTALKPAVEPAVLARKPLSEGTVAENVLEHGTGALNIDGCRIPIDPNAVVGSSPVGRFPANLVHDGSDEVLEIFPHTKSGTGAVKRTTAKGHRANAYGTESRPVGTPNVEYGDEGSASRFFATFNGRDGERSATARYVEEGSTNFAAMSGRLRESTEHHRLFYSSKASKADRCGSKHPCLPPGELVLTDAGYEPIETIGVGRMVYADDGQFHRVIDRFPSPCNTQVFEISVAGTNLRTRATNNHPFLVWRPNGRVSDTIGVGEASWINADSIGVGDYLMTPVAALQEVSTEESADWWFAAGLWMAEGTVLTNGRGNDFPQYTLAAHEIEHVETLRRVFGNVKVYEKPNCGAINVVVFVSGVINRFVSLCGRGARNKYVSPEVLAQSDEKRRAFLLGFLAGDGCRVRNKYRAKTASLRLASTLPLLTESLGMRASVYRYDDGGKITYIGGRPIKHGVYFSIYFDAEHDSGKFVRPIGKQNRTRFVKWGSCVYSIRRVKSVTKQDYHGEVWNITIENRHTFQTVVGMSHNTVKPVDLVGWLCRLVCPPGGTILDPFAGSGTTGQAAIFEGMRVILIEREGEYQRDITDRMGRIETGELSPDGGDKKGKALKKTKETAVKTNPDGPLPFG